LFKNASSVAFFDLFLKTIKLKKTNEIFHFVKPFCEKKWFFNNTGKFSLAHPT